MNQCSIHLVWSNVTYHMSYYTAISVQLVASLALMAPNYATDNWRLVWSNPAQWKLKVIARQSPERAYS